MTRSVLLALMLAMATLHMGASASPVWAQDKQEKKGIFSIFNRQKDTGDTGPIHMNPGTNGASTGKANVYGAGKGKKTTANKYENSPVQKENAQYKASMSNWLSTQKASSLAKGAALNEQVRAETAMAAEKARKEQAAKIAQGAENGRAIAAPPGAYTPAAQAIHQQLKAQSRMAPGAVGGGVQAPSVGANGAIIPPASSRLPQESTVPKKGAKGLFNRIDE